MTMCGYVLPVLFMTILLLYQVYYYVWLCTINTISTLYYSVFVCVTMCYHVLLLYVLLCTTMFDHVWICITVYDYVWPSTRFVLVHALRRPPLNRRGQEKNKRIWWSGWSETTLPSGGECETYKEKRDGLEEEMREIDESDMEEFGTLDSSEKMIVYYLETR